MYSIRTLGAAIAAVALVTVPTMGLCATQDTMTPADRDAAAGQTATQPMTPSASGAATDASGAMPQSTPMPDQAGAPGTVTDMVTTNGPVPDTRANRAKYGRPMSNAGKRTAPAGN
ncbi:MAG TPA: hypothetical protein VII73_02035 [Caulobacteraceae bacterium]